jgi:hypothetical protein
MMLANRIKESYNARFMYVLGVGSSMDPDMEDVDSLEREPYPLANQERRQRDLCQQVSVLLMTYRWKTARSSSQKCTNNTEKAKRTSLLASLMTIWTSKLCKGFDYFS